MAVVELNPPELQEGRVGERAPVLFLAGPIQGAPDWQAEALDIIRASLTHEHTDPDLDIFVANPRTNDFRTYTEQVNWEQRYLWRAHQLGGVAFWWPAETLEAPAPNREGRAYGQTTRSEHGRVMGWLDYNPRIAVAMGMGEGYKGSGKYFHHESGRHNIPMQSSLEDTVQYLLDRVGIVHGIPI